MTGWPRKDFWIVALLSLASILVALVAFEIGMAILRPGPVQGDALLGWKLKQNFQRDFAQRTLGGENYSALFRTNEQGVRVFGTNEKAPIRILVLGDSFVADPYASDTNMWYAKMTERLAERMHRPVTDFYVMAGGGGGWGTYQELLLSKSLARAARPNLFVLQFSSNDFQNNSYEWEKESVVRGQYMRRPFASLDTETPKYAPGIAGAIYRSFIGDMRVFSRIDGMIGTIQAKRYGGSTRPLPPNVQAAYERRALALTKDLLSRLRKEYSGIPAVMVNDGVDQPGPNKSWKVIAREAGFIPLSRPAAFLYALKPDERKRLFYADGSHLANEGNRQFGIIAADEIASLKLPLP